MEALSILRRKLTDREKMFTDPTGKVVKTENTLG